MMKLLPSVLLLAMAAQPVIAGDKPSTDKIDVAKIEAKSPLPAAKMTMQQAMDVLTGLRNLDGHMVITKENGGAEARVMIPWQFENGGLRLTIARNVALLVPVEKQLNDTRDQIIKEILAKMPAGAKQEIQAGTPERTDFNKQFAELMKGPAVGVDLYKIKIGDLKLDKNEIAPTAIAALLPILEQ
jgi:hypothetical protein